VSPIRKIRADYRISLEVAELLSLGCELVYALVPKIGVFRHLLSRSTNEGQETVRAVEHTMAGRPSVGGVDEKIEEHTKRVLKTA